MGQVLKKLLGELRSGYLDLIIDFEAGDATGQGGVVLGGVSLSMAQLACRVLRSASMKGLVNWVSERRQHTRWALDVGIQWEVVGVQSGAENTLQGGQRI